MTHSPGFQTLMRSLALTGDVEKAERRIRRHLKKRDCRLHHQPDGYFAEDRDTRSVKAGPLSLVDIEVWAKGRDLA